MTRAAAANDIPSSILYAVGLTETGKNGVLNPLDLNVEGRSEHSETLPEALGKFHAARSRGVRLIDIGCMQINYHWHARRFTSVESMFDPFDNVNFAARFLKDLRQREGSWTLAVARYNAGPNNNAAQKKYVCNVVRRMIATGMGGWTPSSRKFCDEAKP